MTQVGYYLAELIEQTQANYRDYAPEDVKRLKGLFKAIKSAMCFQLPKDGILFEDNPTLVGIPLDAEGFARPAYPTIVLEFDITLTDNSIEQVVVIVMDNPQIELADGRVGGAVCIPAFKHVGHGNWRTPAFGYILPYDTLGVSKDTGWVHNIGLFPIMPHAAQMVAENAGMGDDVMGFMEGLYQETTCHYVRGYLHLCGALGAHEVTFDDIEPNAATNKMRRARGKMPLFTYKVLTIGKKKPKSRRLGGTHASPRSHLRRGHYRTNSKGVRHWVQPCMVKGETDGFVHKDYIVEGAQA